MVSVAIDRNTNLQAAARVAMVNFQRILSCSPTDWKRLHKTNCTSTLGILGTETGEPVVEVEQPTIFCGDDLPF